MLTLGTVCKYPCLCGGKMTLRDSEYGLYYGCANFPNCGGKVGAHQDSGEPLGTPADDETKKARIEAHEWFDRLWAREGKISKDFIPMRRGQAYAWLRNRMGLDRDECHIGLFNKEQCAEVVRLSKSKLERMRNEPRRIHG